MLFRSPSLRLSSSSSTLIWWERCRDPLRNDIYLERGTPSIRCDINAFCRLLQFWLRQGNSWWWNGNYIIEEIIGFDNIQELSCLRRSVYRPLHCTSTWHTQHDRYSRWGRLIVTRSHFFNRSSFRIPQSISLSFFSSVNHFLIFFWERHLSTKL